MAAHFSNELSDLELRLQLERKQAEPKSLLQTLRGVVGSRKLIVFITRIELDNLGNLGRIVESFPGVQVTTSNVVPLFKLIHISDDIPPPLPPRRILIGNTRSLVFLVFTSRRH